MALKLLAPLLRTGDSPGGITGTGEAERKYRRVAGVWPCPGAEGPARGPGPIHCGANKVSFIPHSTSRALVCYCIEINMAFRALESCHNIELSPFARSTTVVSLDRQQKVVDARERGHARLSTQLPGATSLILAIDMLVAKTLLNEHAAQQLGRALR